jgi:hypothetical protein
VSRKPSSRRNPDNLPDIITTGRHLREYSADALQALKNVNNPPSLFVRSGELVRIIKDEKGSPRILALDEAGLRNQLSKAANFFRLGVQTQIPIVPLPQS